MKAIKYILSVWAILSLSLFCFSCMDEEVPRNDQSWCDGKTLRLTLNAPESRVVSPMTKSAQADTILTNLNVLIYENGALTQSFYYEGDDPVIAELKQGKTKQVDIVLLPDAKGNIYAVANYGSKIEVENTKFGREDGLRGAQFNIEGMQPKKYMYADGGSFDVNNPTQNKKSLALKRIYALVTVKVVKNLTQPSAEIPFDVVPTSLQIKNIPVTGQFAADNKISQSSESMDGEMLTQTDGNDKNFLDADHASAQAFYLYENRQPDGSSLNSNTDQTTKTPAGMPADEIESIVKTNRTCSYIEMHGKYIYNGSETGVGSGSIIYRFFLGKDIVKDFDVERNVHYQVTLTLNGKGGADEATWRVDTELIGEIQVEDVYVGYRAGSKTRMYITGTGVEHIKTISSTVTHLPNGGLKDKPFIVSAVQEEPMPDGTTRFYVDIEANVTNTHDYDKKTGEVTFNVNGNGIERSFTAKIYQVPRLVDPIAFYKKAENKTPVHIQVKEYDPNERAYIDLNSKGSWTATIKHSAGSATNWYEIYNTDKEGNKIGTGVSQEGGEIRGEGLVQFGYTPLSENGYADGDEGLVDKARYGMIQVKYHNDWCEHEIYLRQGYQPTIMGDEGYAWSMFNCLGKKTKDENEVGEVVEYPTQTGWFFNGGVDISMHPFKPGFGVTDFAALEYSDGETGYSYKKHEGDKNAWGYKENSGQKDFRKLIWRGKRGPCPEGYVVPTAPTYRTLTNTTEIYTGYVHDDDPVKGWRYGANSKGAILDDNNNCNPAKGALFIDKENDYTNVFFNFGKGVKTDLTNSDPKLIPEIGVGHRYDNESGSNFITLGNGYEGYYWNGTSFGDVPTYWWDFWGIGASGGGDHMGKVHFGYDVFSKEPTLLDVPGWYSALSETHPAVGIDRFHNGSFVRCVKDLKPYQYPTITLGGMFYKGTTPFTGTLTIGFYLTTNTAEYPSPNVAVPVTFKNGVPVNPIVTISLRDEVVDKVILRTSGSAYAYSTITALKSEVDKEVK